MMSMSKFRFWKNLIIFIIFILCAFIGIFYFTIEQTLAMLCALMLFSIIDRV